MIVLLIILSVVAGVALLEGIAFVLYAKKAPASRKRTLEFLLYGRTRSYTKESQPASQAAAPRYAEHPFTGWSLNPDFLNIHGEKIHNRQGFRCSRDLEALNPDAFRIYCAGGSTTYCTDIERNEDTWPHLLGQYLSQASGREVEVINGAVGGFNTFQSYIRLSAYIDYLRPNLVVVYHAKNDLTPFYSGYPDNGKALPDYSNLMRSLNFRGMADSITPLARYSFLGKLWAAWRLSAQTSLAYVHGSARVPDIATLLAARTDYSIIETMQRNMVSLCRGRDITLVYMTQRVVEAIFNRYIQAINDRVRGLEDPRNNCFVFDLDRVLSYDPALLVDKMHFTAEGCQRVAQHLAQFLNESGLLVDKRVSQRSV